MIWVVDIDQAGVAPIAFIALILRSSQHIWLTPIIKSGIPALKYLDSFILDGLNVARYYYFTGYR